MADSLQKLFGSSARVKLLRLFLFNPGRNFTVAEAAERAQLDESVAREEMHILHQASVVRRSRRGKQTRYFTDEQFPYMQSLQSLLLNVAGRGEEIRRLLRTTGTVKLIIIMGMFVGEWESGIDLLVVGDRVQERMFKKHIKKLEAEIGKEIRYTLLTTADFLYRLNMSDKLMRDVFDYPHKIILDKFDIGLK